VVAYRVRVLRRDWRRVWAGDAVSGQVENLSETDKCVAKFYFLRGPCCAGCDAWQHDNAFIGECLHTVPTSGHDRIGMLNITSCSLQIDAGHIFTKRDHHCGEFRDTFDWSSLSPMTRKAIGAP
jgi:hypothetical protein